MSKFNYYVLAVGVFVVGAVVNVGDVISVYAEIFFPSTVAEIRESLEEASDNGESDVVVVLPGVYQINTALRYQAKPSDEDKALLIGGLGSVFKPTFQRGEDGDDTGLLTLIHDYSGNITVADMIFEGARKYGQGGAVSISTGEGTIRLINNRFVDNETVGAGGGASLTTDDGTIEVFNNIFERNRVPGGSGGGLEIVSWPGLYGSGLVQLNNNTFLNNEAAKGGGVDINRRKHTLAAVYSNIFWGNLGAPRDLFHVLNHRFSETGVADHCTLIYHNQIGDFLFEPSDRWHADVGCYDTYQNSDSDPLLDGFVPRAGSPVIDTGPDPDGPMLAWWIYPPVYDYRAKARIVDGNGDGREVIDRGAIEVDISVPAGGTSPSPLLPLRVIPDVPKSFGKLPSVPVKYLRISEVAANSDRRVGWTISPERSTSGTFALYYGDPVSGNYQTGKAANSGVIKLPEMKFGKGDHPLLCFMLYMDTERDSKVDTLGVYANKDLVWEKSPRTVRMGQWQPVIVDMKPYSGEMVKMAIKFDTVNGSVNNSEGVYIDDIIISRNGRVPAKYRAPNIVQKQGKK